MQDKIISNGAWEFNSEVASVFSDMLERSIPQYHVMRDACLSIVSILSRRDGLIIDIGCSNGESLQNIVDFLGNRNKYLGIDVSEPMLNIARARFEYMSDMVDIRNLDIRTGTIQSMASAVLSILTIQFIPIEYRQRVIKKIYNAIEPGGIFVFVEKVIGASCETDCLFNEIYYNLKADNMYTQEQIQSKRKSLEGVLVPVTEGMNIDMLKNAGFVSVESFWRWMNFIGFVAIKSKG